MRSSSCFTLGNNFPCSVDTVRFSIIGELNLTADFSAVYTPGFLDMIRRWWFDREITKKDSILPWISYQNQTTRSEIYFDGSLNVSLVIQKKRTVIHNLFSRNLIAIHVRVIARVVSIYRFFGLFLNLLYQVSTLIFKEIFYFTLFSIKTNVAFFYVYLLCKIWAH